MGTGAGAVQAHMGPESSPAGHGYGGPGNVQSMGPPYNSGSHKGASEFGVWDIALRAISAVFALISLSIVASTNEGNLQALDYRPFQFSLTISVFVLVYELVQIFLLMGGISSHMITFFLDQVLAYLTFSASSITGYFATSLRYGDGPDTHNSCQGSMSIICSKTEASSAMGFFAFGSLAALALLSGLKLAKNM